MFKEISEEKKMMVIFINSEIENVISCIDNPADEKVLALCWSLENWLINLDEYKNDGIALILRMLSQVAELKIPDNEEIGD